MKTNEKAQMLAKWEEKFEAAEDMRRFIEKVSRDRGLNFSEVLFAAIHFSSCEPGFEIYLDGFVEARTS